MLKPNVDAAFRRLVAALVGPEPLPAGGSAAVAAIAMGVGLGIKVTRISSAGSAGLGHTQHRLEAILEWMLPEFTEDCAAFSNLLDVLRRPQDDTAREAGLEKAWRDATAAPVRVATVAREVEALLAGCGNEVKASVRADLGAALELVRAGRRIAEVNAQENAQRLDPQLARELLAPLDRGKGSAGAG
ncbi:MAG: cyclodeaminase/cyclohydrolase family protein [Planctomycetes bacterium]|nr:cyclodeaminase/cyclohydrolase family protein [Planctomycetota bacterium]